MTAKCSPLARFSCRCIWFPLPVQLPPPRQPEYPQLQTYIPHLEFSRQRPGEKRHLEHRLRHLPHLLPPFWNLRYNTCLHTPIGYLFVNEKKNQERWNRDCKTVRTFAYSYTREQSNKRSGARLKTESETFLLLFSRLTRLSLFLAPRLSGPLNWERR